MIALRGLRGGEEKWYSSVPMAIVFQITRNGMQEPVRRTALGLEWPLFVSVSIQYRAYIILALLWENIL
jgi:hypothetical protein